jgi:hypothetical protein
MSNDFTYPSLPGIVAGLKNPEIVESKFVYNFFMSDERVNERSQVNYLDFLTDTATYVSRIAKAPRYVQLKLKQDWSTSTYVDLSRLRAGEIQILYEDAPFGRNFSSVVVQDTSADARSYYMISGSSDAIFTSDLGVASLDVASESVEDRASSLSASTVNEKSFLFNSLKNIQSAGYQYASTDISGIAQNDFLLDVKGFSASVSMNNLFIYDITKRILDNEMSIFADEFAAASTTSKKIQKKSRRQSTPYSVSSEEYDLTIPYQEYELLDSSTISDTTMTASHVGFVIEKYAQNTDATVTPGEITYLDAKTTDFYDEAIRYGGLYSYTVRALYEITLYASVETDSSRGLDLARVKLFFATSGQNVDIFCVETRPPPPPEDVYFKYTPEGNLFIGWQFPFNKQRDIKKFQIFRRKSLDEPFRLIRQIDFDDSVVKTPSADLIPRRLISYKKIPTCFFVDNDFNFNSKFIYSIVSVDAHGYTSNYSTQFEVSVNIYTETLVINDVVRKGCPKPYPNLFLNRDFFIDLAKDSNHTRMTVYFDPDYTDLVDKRGNSLNLINFNKKRPSYKIHILETNLAQDQIVNITTTNDKSLTIPISEAKVYTQVV